MWDRFLGGRWSKRSIKPSLYKRRLGLEVLEDRRLLANVPDGFTETVVASGLTSPITMDIEESGRIWLAFQDGRIEVIENDALLPQIAIQLDTDGSGERGLQGIELDPDFENNHYLYVYYTAASPESHNRLSRLTVDPLTDNTFVAGSELVLLDLPGFSTFPQNTDPIWHMGGAIHFMEDGTLAVQVGDHLNNSLVQNLDFPLGKILRVNTDGSPATDNPFYNDADGIGWRDYVWAAGLRNPFSGDIDPVTGRYFVNDVGEGTWEEINDVTEALNFGWPTTEGMFNPSTYPNFTNPVVTYNHSVDCAVTGGAFNSFASTPIAPFPGEYDGQYFYSQFCAGRILVVDPDNPGDIETFISDASFPMNIEFGPDGSMYYIARGAGAGGAPGIGTGQVLKVQFVANIAPQIVQHPADQLVSVGQGTLLSASAAGTPELLYQWQRHNGTMFVDISGETSSSLVIPGTTLADDGAQFRVIVSNDFGTATSQVATLAVTTDTPPTAQITLPEDGTLYRAGDLVEFSGSALDLEDGQLAAASLTWQIDFHHDDHLHPFFPPTSGLTGGQFEVPVNSETSANVWFRIHLFATDSAGLTTEIIRDIHPVTTDFTVQTNIGGGTVLIDGQPKQTPTTITGVVNVNRSLEASPVVSIGGAIGTFIQWLDGQSNLQRVIATPEEDTAYVAIYENTSLSMPFLSDLVPSNDPPPNGWGPIELDTSNGEQPPGDGIPIAIEDVEYTRGLGVHANSDVRYALGGAYSRFLADIGMDDENGNAGSVEFQVYGDGNLLYESPTIFGNSDRITLDIDVSGVNELQLVVDDAGNGNGNDHADWANARLIPVGAGDRIYVNFQPTGATLPAGYIADDGAVFGPHARLGLDFGWSTQHTAIDRDSFGVEELLETGILVQPNEYWEVAVPDGMYAVTVAVGDAGDGNGTNNTVNVEGRSLWSGLGLGGNDFAVQTRVVTVNDGRLTVDVGDGDATRIDFVEIIPLPDAEESGLFPFAAADVNLNGRLTLQDARDLAAGWGVHDSESTLEELVRGGDLNFDQATDEADWAIFEQQWNSQNPQPLSLAALLNPIAGDYFPDGEVDQQDYDTWKASYGSTSELSADGNGDGLVSAADYTVWRNNLGAELGTVSQSMAPVPQTVSASEAFVPLAGVSIDDAQRSANSRQVSVQPVVPQLGSPIRRTTHLLNILQGTSRTTDRTMKLVDRVLDDYEAGVPGRADAVTSELAVPLAESCAEAVV